MDSKKSKIRIDLSGKPKQSLTGDFLKWTINGGRIIIVTTELIALGALLYRFNIDRKIIDLHDQIKKADLFVKSQQAKESNYRSIQERLVNIKETENQTSTKFEIITGILNDISTGEFTSTNLAVSSNVITVNGTSFSVFSVNNFIEDLKQNPNVASISIDEVTSSINGVKFRINIELKTNKQKT